MKRAIAAACFSAAAWLVASAALAADAVADIARGDAPAWVVPHDIPKPSKTVLEQSSDGLAWLLIDSQVQAAPDGYDSYGRSVTRVLSRSGLEEAGAIRVEFDPRSESVTLNYVHVIRDGKVIDHTKDLALELIRREHDLEDGLIDGRVTAAGNLPDIRVGDLIDYAVTTHVTDSLWRGHYFGQLTTRFSEPLALRVERIIWPSSQPILFKRVNTAEAFTVTTAGDKTIYELVQRDPAPQAGEDNVPSWTPAWGVISMSTMKSWQEVAQWAAPLYQGDESFGGDFAKEVDRIAARWSRPEDRLTEAARLVQDRIRYVGVEIGPGSYVPRRPAEVVRQGYGDCKDKALLLTAVLHRLGIEAAPALVATRRGKALRDWAPSPGAFNHAIVRAEIDGKPVWIDATLAHQGGRGLRMTTPDYGYVLPVRAGQSDLELITPPAGSMDVQEVVEHFEVDQAADTAMRLTVTTTFRDDMANWMREKVATEPASDIGKRYVDYYLDAYPGIVPTRLPQIEDDRDANVLKVSESYTLSRAEFEKGKLGETFPVRADALRHLLPEKQGAPRKNPLRIYGEARRTHVVEVEAKGLALSGLPDLDETVEGMRFQRVTKYAGDREVITFTLTTTEDVVPAEKAAAVYAFSDKVKDETYLEFNFAKSAKSLAQNLGVNPEELAPYEERLRQAALLLGKAEPAANREALTLLTALSSEVKRPSGLAGLIDGFRGLSLVAANRMPAALAALESSFAQYQGNFDLLNMLALLQIDADKPQDAVRTLAAVVKNHPARVDDITEETVEMLSRRLQRDKSDAGKAARGDLNVLLAQAGWRQSPMSDAGDAVRGAAIAALVERGRTDEARKLMAVAPLSSTAAASLAIDNRYRSLWPALDKAVQDRFRGLIAQDVARSTQAVAKSPGDLKLLARHVEDLRRAGQIDKAIAAAKTAASDRSRIEAAGEDGYWLVNQYASSLFDAGQREAAIKEMDWLLSLGLDQNPTLMNQAINRAEMLQNADRTAEAFAAYSALDGDAAKHASDYGKMWIWAGLACTAHDLHKTDVMEANLAKLNDKQDENLVALSFALACVSDIPGLERALIRRMDRVEDRPGAVGSFSTTLDKPQSALERRVLAAAEQARAAPAVQAKFKAYGRAVAFDGRTSLLGGY